jgi:hypothetical protein
LATLPKTAHKAPLRILRRPNLNKRVLLPAEIAFTDKLGVSRHETVDAAQLQAVTSVKEKSSTLQGLRKATHSPAWEARNAERKMQSTAQPRQFLRSWRGLEFPADRCQAGEEIDHARVL